MADFALENIEPVPSWDDVPELGMSTPARGGKGGPMNLQAQALANRDEFIKDRVEKTVLYFRTRDDFVTALAGERIGPLHDGFIVRAGDLLYKARAGASVLPGLPGFIHSGDLDGRHHGMVCDGVADDAGSMRSWSAHVSTIWNSEQSKAVLRGKIRLNSPVVITCNQSSTSRHMTFDWSGAEFICGFERTAAAESMLTIGNQLSPYTYSAPFSITGRYRVARRADINYPPVALRLIGTAQSDVNHPTTSSWGNTLVEFWGPQNVEVEDWTMYSGGYCFGFKDASASRFRRTGTTLNRVSGDFVFDSSCVGKVIRITPLENEFKCRIVAYLSPTSVQIESSASANDSADRQIRFGSPAVFTTAGSNIVRLDGPVTPDMAGLFVGIPLAGFNQKILFARITAVDPANQTLTLSKAASQTLDPATNPETETTEIACPAVAVLSELASEGGYYANGASQFRMGNIQIETYRGVAIMFDDVELVSIMGWKSHGVQTDYRWDLHSIGDIWGNRLSGYFIGEFDAARYGLYRLRFGDQTQPFNFQHIGARSANGEKLLHVSPMVSGYESAVVSFGFLSLVGGTPGAFTNLVDDMNAAYPGYVPPLQLVRSDKNELYQYLGPSIVAKPNGQIDIGNGAITYDKANNILLIGNNVAVRAQAPVFRIQDVDNNGNMDIAFQASYGGATVARFRVNSGTGSITPMVNEVPRGFSINTRSSAAAAIPVCADNAAAIAAGLLASDVYKTPSGDLKVVI